MLIESLRDHIVSKLGHEPGNLDLVLDRFVPLELKKNQTLLEINEVCRFVYFLAEGCLKTTALDVNGNETTTHLAFEGSWRTAMRSFVNQSPSNERLVAVEDVKLLAINYHDFQMLSSTVPEFEHIYKGLLEESYTFSVERMQTLMAMDALSRVNWLLERHPMIFTRLSNRLIASYLGISEATLSRLKAKL